MTRHETVVLFNTGGALKYLDVLVSAVGEARGALSLPSEPLPPF